MYSALLQGRLPGDGALGASQQLLLNLMDSMATAVFWKDRDSCYLGCNQVFASFAGLEPADLVGKCDRDMPWAEGERFNADWFIDWDQLVMDTGEPKFGILEQLKRANGELRALETNKVPLRDVSGQIIGVLGTFEDVTERRQAEDELKRTLDELDERVKQRTAELVRANDSLRREIEDRVRIQAEERQQRSYAEALRDTAAAMSKTLDLEEVMEQVLVGVERLVSNDLTAIVLVNSDGDLEMARQRVGFGYPVDEPRSDCAPLHNLSVISEVTSRSEAAVVDAPVCAIGSARSALGAPMRLGDQQIGFVFVESATLGYFTESHTDRLRAIADQAAAAISNARLASKASEVAAADERHRLSQELHDAVNQTLWTASLTADSMLRELDEDCELGHGLNRLRQLTRGALAEMRTLLLEQRPTELARTGLDELIDQLLVALECRKTLDVTAALEPVDLVPETSMAFYRIAQGALSNVARHAQATKLSISLRGGATTELRIVDDGCGFDPGAVPAGHLGLTIMRERADSIGARFNVNARPGAGTDLRLWIENNR